MTDTKGDMPVLSDEEARKIEAKVIDSMASKAIPRREFGVMEGVRAGIQAQNEADRAYMNSKLAGIQEEQERLNTKLDDVDLAIRQAKQEARTQLIQEIEKEYPELQQVEPSDNYEETMKRLRARIDKWQAFKEEKRV